MVTCCVPSCCTNSRKCDPAISFHEFPTEPDIVAKWIRNINTVVKNGGTWYPRDEDKPYICSKHFLPTDFRTETEVPTLKPRSVPTLFANILGFSSSCMNPPMKRKIYTHSPLIVKINKNSEASDISCESNRSPRTEQSSVSENLNFDVGNQSEPIQTAPSFKTSAMSVGQSLLKKTCEVSDNRRLVTLNKKKSDLELIEIGPNTFLKINPKVIKIAKKVTPSGNSVLQFIMNKGSPVKNTPEIITIDDSEQSDVRGPELGVKKSASESDQRNVGSSSKNVTSGKSLDNVIGHLVDSHFGRELSMTGKDNPVNIEPTEIVIGSDSDERSSNSYVAESDFIQKAPVLLTTGVPVSRCLTTGQRLMGKLKQKNRELKALRKKLSRLQSRLETAENKCIVQERELSYAKVKKIKAIRKAAAKGDPSAVYILEQIKAFDGNPVMRWSDSTLRQCSIWCRKAPYAYEYFKKADLFKLPCLSTVKRFMKKCPPEQLQAVQRRQGIDDDSSSDFNFDSSEDDDDDKNTEQDKENIAEASAEMRNSVLDQDGSAVLPQSSTATNSNEGSSAEKDSVANLNDQNDSAITSTTSDIINDDSSSNGHTVQTNETAASDVQTSQANTLSVQEVVLPQGIVQCLNSKLASGQPQYFIIPTLGDQNIMSDHQYSVLQSNSGPLIIQNVQNNQLPLSQEQLIFIAHSAESSTKSN